MYNIYNACKFFIAHKHVFLRLFCKKPLLCVKYFAFSKLLKCQQMIFVYGMICLVRNTDTTLHLPY